ncbi:MAG: glycine-rich protein, partial [Opitutales bacterium]
MNYKFKIFLWFIPILFTCIIANANTYTFTTAGSSGREGPTQAQIDSNYAGTNLANSISINTRGIQEWTVPADGNYSLEVWGAQGGRGGVDDSIVEGGLGARVKGIFNLSQNQVLKIIVGQKGLGGGDGVGGGGGGGSFIVVGSTPLIVAGGGGGGSYNSTHEPGVDSRIGGEGKAELSTSTAAGTTSNASGGAGFLSNSTAGSSSGIAKSFTNGGTGATGKTNHDGGFGGGGGGSLSFPSGGGGGGYQGGNASGQSWTPSIGQSKGGYSYNSGTDQNNTSGINSGHGKVIITPLQTTTYTFTNAGASGRDGPTQAQIDSNYSGTNLANSVSINTSGIQEWTVPISGSYFFELWGASGGEDAKTNTSNVGGNGGYASGKISLNSGDIIYILVGQQGVDTSQGVPAHGGFNGGGDNQRFGGSGGGASDIRFNGSELVNRIIVAGGGGGAYGGSSSGNGGDGGGLSGQNGTSGNGGTQSSGGNDGGVLGVGGFSNPADSGGAGGGGYYGGGAANSSWGSGGGGSSYIGGVLEGNTTSGVNEGHGLVVITVLSSFGNLNQAPIITQGIGPQTKTINEDTSATWTASELNATDSDTNASSLSWSLLTAPSHGTAIVDGNGSSPAILSYQPNANFNGSDSFSVQVSDGENNDSITINLTVNSVNDNPTIYSINGQTLSSALTAEIQVQENSSVSLDINASDSIEGDTLTFQKTAGADRDLFDLNSTTGVLSIASAPDFENPTDADANNTYEIWFRANDGNGGFDEKRLTIRVTNVVEDNDGDGIEDAYDPDDDNDGFSDAVEIAYGSDPMDANSTANAPPADLNTTSALQVSENQSTGTVVGQLTATDPDANATLTFTLVAGANDNHLFSIDTNGTLKTASVFNYESNSSHTIQAKVRDQYNLWIKENFTVQITNIIEDLDRDGTEDHFDTDDDGDGFSDIVEIAYGSDPMDANSTANTAPTDLNTTSALQVAENQSIGRVVGQLTAIDPDANATLTFTLVSGSNDNHLFSIDTNGTIRTATVFNYESNSSHTIRAKVRDQYNLWIKENFTVQITNIIEDLDGDGTEDHFDTDDDGDGFSDAVEIAYGS